MAQQFFTILTNKGKEREAAASAGNPVAVTKMVFGSGLNDNYYNPVVTQTALKKQVHVEDLNNWGVHPSNSKWVIAEALIDATVGDFTIREVGLIDANDNLIAIGVFPETYKPIMEQGSTKDLVVRIVTQVDDPENFSAIIDPNVIRATQAWTMEQIVPMFSAFAETTLNIQNEQLKQAETIKNLTGDYS